MKRSLRSPSLFIICVAFLVAGSLSADIIVLKSGEKIDCTILSETDTTLTYKYHLTPKIEDTKTIPKADIKELTRFTPAQVEYNAKGLDKIIPTEDLLSASDYESIIQDDLRTFVAKFPGTPEADKVNKMIDTLNEEKNKVLAGQVKVKGKWLDEATAKREKYNIDAYELRIQMKKQMEDLSQEQVMPKEIKALRAFDELRTKFPASEEYIEAIPEALDILDKYEKRLSALALNQPILKAERDRAKAANDQSRQAIDQEERIFKANQDAQKKAKMKWRDISMFDMAAIKDAQAAVTKEKLELKSINLPALQNEIENLNAAIRYIADGNAAEAEAVMGRLRPTKNNLVNKKVFDEFDKKLKDLQAKINAQIKAEKAAAANSAPAATGETGSESSNPIAEAMTKKKEAKAKEEAKRIAKAKSEAATAANPTTTKAAPEEEQTMLQKINAYIPYIGAGLLVVLVIAMVMGKKKKEEDD
jgi:hypothetical protein